MTTIARNHLILFVSVGHAMLTLAWILLSEQLQAASLWFEGLIYALMHKLRDILLFPPQVMVTIEDRDEQ